MKFQLRTWKFANLWQTDFLTKQLNEVCKEKD